MLKLLSIFSKLIFKSQNDCFFYTRHLLLSKNILFPDAIFAPDGLTATVTFAAGEKSVRLFGYAPQIPKVMAQSGSVGALAYDAGSGKFSVEVSPAALIIAGQDPTQTAVIQFTGK